MSATIEKKASKKQLAKELAEGPMPGFLDGHRPVTMADFMPEPAPVPQPASPAVPVSWKYVKPAKGANVGEALKDTAPMRGNHPLLGACQEGTLRDYANHLLRPDGKPRTLEEMSIISGRVAGREDGELFPRKKNGEPSWSRAAGYYGGRLQHEVLDKKLSAFPFRIRNDGKKGGAAAFWIERIDGQPLA